MTPIVVIVSLFSVIAFFLGGVTTAFNMGKLVQQRWISPLHTLTPKVIITTPTPLPIIVSKEGTIKATYQLQPTPIITIVAIENSIISPDTSISGVVNTPTVTSKLTISTIPQALHYILISRSGATVFLTNISDISLQNYTGLCVDHRHFG